jgi:outer membrane protein OmpA-like peptidoglycan-associated protein
VDEAVAGGEQQGGGAEAAIDEAQRPWAEPEPERHRVGREENFLHGGGSLFSFDSHSALPAAKTDRNVKENRRKTPHKSTRETNRYQHS